MTSRSLLRVLPVAAKTATLCSCASVSVTNVITLENRPPVHLPRGIYAAGRSSSMKAMACGPRGKKLDEFQKELQDANPPENRVARFPQKPSSLRRVAQGAPSAVVPKGDFWVVTGRFTRINQGAAGRCAARSGSAPAELKLDVSATVSKLQSGTSQAARVYSDHGRMQCHAGRGDGGDRLADDYQRSGSVCWPRIDGRRLPDIEGKIPSAALNDYLKKLSACRSLPMRSKPKREGESPACFAASPKGGCHRSAVPYGWRGDRSPYLQRWRKKAR